MAGTKRSAAESGEGRSTRASKAAKTDDNQAIPSKNKKSSLGKKGPKVETRASLAPSAFKSKALPLHVHITHTPPVIGESNGAAVDAAADADAEDTKSKTTEERVPAASADPGAIGSVTLLPSVFSTGSYGWKGSKRVTIAMPNADGGEGEEKVQVMITINATVIGSKKTKDDGKEGDSEVKEGAEEVADGEVLPAEAAEE
ncbi:hypothetical protein EW145_g2531 [Phellinidium pouzarii]|uniref:Uncharacterized protein n=1 Tax=Phellinidium pouzarii TaxID=167371 RepID=A0A4S4LFZ7_9AGAM|nr:hypothetical protein EW145_g2531 [Phellinidium pouzarii]